MCCNAGANSKAPQPGCPASIRQRKHFAYPLGATNPRVTCVKKLCRRTCALGLRWPKDDRRGCCTSLYCRVLRAGFGVRCAAPGAAQRGTGAGADLAAASSNGGWAPAAAPASRSWGRARWRLAGRGAKLCRRLLLLVGKGPCSVPQRAFPRISSVSGHQHRRQPAPFLCCPGLGCRQGATVPAQADAPHHPPRREKPQPGAGLRIFSCSWQAPVLREFRGCF